MKDKEYLRPFLSKTIHICDRCGKLDIKTYERYKLKEDKYVLDGIYSRCQNCIKTQFDGRTIYYF